MRASTVAGSAARFLYAASIAYPLAHEDAIIYTEALHLELYYESFRSGWSNRSRATADARFHRHDICGVRRSNIAAASPQAGDVAAAGRAYRSERAAGSGGATRGARGIGTGGGSADAGLCTG